MMRFLTGVKNNKRAQMTILIIVALVIVAGIATYFIIRSQMGISNIPENFIPVYDYYQSCAAERLKMGIELTEGQGGRIYAGEFVPGSLYAPSGNQLNFFGFGVPYWYYLTGNGLIKENIPLKSDIENDIEKYIEENLANCNLDKYYEQGFYVDFGEPTAKVSISSGKVSLALTQSVSVSKEGQNALKQSFSIESASKLGKFYSKAVEIYQNEKKDAFIENYATDVLRNYAPVDGVEISCSGKVWKSREVANELMSALEANMQAIKFNGNYYSLANADNKYFVVKDVSIDSGDSAQLLYSRQWPTKIEIDGDNVGQELMIAKPVGMSQGMGMMGFCYAPYHFIYSVVFPVMIQIYDADEVFQFPIIAVIDKNMPRQGIYSEVDNSGIVQDLCEMKTNEINVNVYDANLNSLDANVSYKCFNQECALGETINGRFDGLVPGCYNGYLTARADGYRDAEVLFSSNEQTAGEIIMDRNYEVQIDVQVGGKELGAKTAIVTFTNKDDNSIVSTALPDNNVIKLSEGLYEASVYVYSASGIKIPASTKTECTEIPRGGLLGIVGMTKEQCFTVELPATTIESALAGGGKSEVYLFADELSNGQMTIKVESLDKPDTIEKLQKNYELFETLGVEVDF